VVIVAWQLANAPESPPPGKEDAKGVTAPDTPGETDPDRQPTETDPDLPTRKPEDEPAGQDVESFTEKDVLIQNEVLAITFTNRGGAIKSAVLLDQFATAGIRNEGGPPLELIGNSGATVNSGPVGALTLSDASLAGSHLAAGEWEAEIDQASRKVTYTRTVKRGKEKAYELVIKKELWLHSENARRVDFRISCEYVSDTAGGGNYTHELQLFTSGGIWQEKGSEASNPGSSFVFPEEADSEDGERIAGKEVQEKKEGKGRVLRGAHRYVADLSTYFGAYLYAGEGFPASTQGVVHYLKPSEMLIEKAHDTLGSPAERSYSGLKFDLELGIGTGPQEVSGFLYIGSHDVVAADPELAAENPEVTHALSAVAEDRLGFTRPISKVILGILHWLHGIFGNWGWSIVVLTVMVRLVLFPVNRRSQGAMLRHGEAMAKIKPQIAELKKKYEKEPKKFTQEQMALMKREGVSMVPLGGCLPLFLQIPIFFGLFSALRTSIDLRQAPWWWVQDLSQPDHLITFDTPIWNPMSFCSGCCQIPVTEITGLHILPILMSLAWFLNSYLMPRPTTVDPQMEQQRKMMMFMPLFFGFMMYSYAAGLSLYWLTSSTIGIFETKVIKKYFPVKHPPKKPSPKT